MGRLLTIKMKDEKADLTDHNSSQVGTALHGIMAFDHPLTMSFRR